MGGQRSLQLLVWGVVALGLVSATWVVLNDYMDGPAPERVAAARAPDDRGGDLPALPTPVPSNASDDARP